MICDGCHVDRDESMFGDVPGGEKYPHLGLKNVCKLCQVKHKKCGGRCTMVYPANRLWFFAKPNGKFGLYHDCKKCRSEHMSNNYRLRKARNA